MTSYGTVHPRDMAYDMAHIFIVLQQQVPSTLGTSHLSVFTHLGLSPISSLFLFWNLGKITLTFWLNVGTYPPCLCYPHHVYPSARITWKYRITSDNPRLMARTTSIFVVSPSTLYPPVHIGTIVV